jgi:phage/plasmid-like protein (TIGR03299 family)
MSANTERIVVVRGIPAWHNENSTVLPDDAVDFATIVKHVPQLGMMVAPRQLMYWDEAGKPHVVPDMVANVRADGTYVGCVGDGYQAVQGQEGFMVLSELLKPNGAGEREVIADTAGTLAGGRKLFIACRASEEFYVGGSKDERHTGFLTFLNSFDSSTKVGLVLSTVRTVCENTFNANMGSHEAAYWFVHTSNVMERIEEARQSLSVAGRYFKEYERRANALLKVQMGIKDWSNLVNYLVADPKELEQADKKRAAANAEREREELNMIWINAPDLQNVRGTAYAALQTVTAWNDHYHMGRKSQQSSVAENRTRRILLEPSLKQKAANYLFEMAEISS